MSTRARSKLPSGKNILVFGELRRRGGAWGAGVGEAGTPFTGLSLSYPRSLPLPEGQKTQAGESESGQFQHT